VAADVVEAANLAVLAADGQDGLVDDVQRLEIPRRRHVVDVADEVPALPEHDLALQVEELGVGIGPPGQAEVVFRAKIRGDDTVGVNTCIHC
jgi:hypothetical protein